MTNLSVAGDGIVTAYYEWVPVGPPQEYHIGVLFQSAELTGPTVNLGSIYVGNATWGASVLPSEVELDDGLYYLNYTAAPGYVFDHWGLSPSENLSMPIGEIRSANASLTVAGSGGVTAFYRRPAVTLLSQEVGGQTMNLGTITLDGVPHSLPQTLYALMGEHSLNYTEEAGYEFKYWGTSGGVTLVGAFLDRENVVTVLSDGNVTAYYMRLPYVPPGYAIVDFMSFEVNGTSSNLGSIGFDSGPLVPLSPDGLAVATSNGGHSLAYEVENPNLYKFVGWTTRESVSVASNGSSTTLTVSGSGTAIAWYIRLPTPNTIYFHGIDLNGTVIDVGTVTLSGLAKQLPCDFQRWSGSYPLEYSETGVFRFWNWTSAGDVQVAQKDSRSTMLQVDGDGTVYVYYYRTVYEVVFESKEVDGDNTSNLGTIVFNGVSYPVENQPARAYVPAGNYSLRYLPAYGYNWTVWTTTPLLQAGNQAQSYLVVGGDGTVTAWYTELPNFWTVTLQSREVGGTRANLGKIGLNGTYYEPLPRWVEVPSKKGGSGYTVALNFTDPPGFTFSYWEASGAVSVPSKDLSKNVTTLTIKGDGVVTAYYVPVAGAWTANVNYQSVEVNGTGVNSGWIGFGDGNFYDLPILNVPYSGVLLPYATPLLYLEEPDYRFVNWTVQPTANLSVSSPFGNTTLRISGDGNVTAYYVYRYSRLELTSRFDPFGGPSSAPDELGWIYVDSWYDLPAVAQVKRGDHDLAYRVENSSYIFLVWESDGNVVISSIDEEVTKLNVTGDGKVTAIYSLKGEPPPPTAGWETIYVDIDNKLHPYDLWTQDDGKLHPFSMGSYKQVTVLMSTPTPDLLIADLVIVSLYLRPNPPAGMKNATIELGFTWNDIDWTIGKTDLLKQGPLEPDDFKEVPVDTRNGTYPYNITGFVPAGSTIICTLTVQFFDYWGWGTFFIFHGVDWPSRIELYKKAPLTLSAFSENVGLSDVKLQLDGNLPSLYFTGSDGRVLVDVDPGNHTIELLTEVVSNPVDPAGYYEFNGSWTATWLGESVPKWETSKRTVIVVFVRYGADVTAWYGERTSSP